MFPFFQSPGTSSDCYDLSNIMESGLTMTPAHSQPPAKSQPSPFAMSLKYAFAYEW